MRKVIGSDPTVHAYPAQTLIICLGPEHQLYSSAAFGIKSYSKPSVFISHHITFDLINTINTMTSISDSVTTQNNLKSVLKRLHESAVHSSQACLLLVRNANTKQREAERAWLDLDNLLDTSIDLIEILSGINILKADAFALHDEESQSFLHDLSDLKQITAIKVSEIIPEKLSANPKMKPPMAGAQPRGVFHPQYDDSHPFPSPTNYPNRKTNKPVIVSPPGSPTISRNSSQFSIQELIRHETVSRTVSPALSRKGSKTHISGALSPKEGAFSHEKKHSLRLSEILSKLHHAKSKEEKNGATFQI